MQSDLAASWLLTLALHTGALLALVWCIDRGLLRARLAWRELLWRVALFGGLLSASAQTLLGPPTAPRIALPGRLAAAAIAPEPAEFVRPAVLPERTVAAQVPHESNLAPVAPAVAAAAPAAKASAVSPWRPSWPLVVLAGWLAGVLLALGRLAAASWRLERLLARAEPLQRAAVAVDAAALATQARLDVSHLRVLDDLASPIAARGHRIVLPRWALERLDRERLRAMLAHETAHLARRDPAWKLAIALWCALFWFLPLAALARRRLDEVAELACDAWAAAHLGDGRPLAECLLECAERHADGIDLALVPAMAHRQSPLLQRIDHLIGGSSMHLKLPRVRAAATALFVLVAAAAALPGFGTLHAAAPPADPTAPPVPPTPPVPPAPPAPPAPEGNGGHHRHVSGDFSLFGLRSQYTSIEVSDGKRGLQAKIKGELVFNEQEDGIASLGSGASASFGETRDGSKRRIDYTSRDGKIEQHYFVDGREQPVDAAAQRWIAEIIPVVIRETALDAKQRVARLQARGGAAAVLDEIGRIESGYARGVYVKELAASAKLTPAEATRVLGLIDGIDSDYERRNALTALGSAQPLDAAQQKLVLAQAAKIGSDYERAEMLLGLLPKLAPDGDVRTAWLQAATGIRSDYEQRRTLSALLKADPIDDAGLVAVIDAAQSIHSDYERRELLVATAARAGDAERIAPAYAAATAGIGSDFERRQALQALIGAPKFGTRGSEAVLDTAAKIGSDFECREVLVALARVMPNDTALIERYRGVARRLSDHERGAAERALDRFAL